MKLDGAIGMCRAQPAVTTVTGSRASAASSRFIGVTSCAANMEAVSAEVLGKRWVFGGFLGPGL